MEEAELTDWGWGGRRHQEVPAVSAGSLTHFAGHGIHSLVTEGAALSKACSTLMVGPLMGRQTVHCC